MIDLLRELEAELVRAVPPSAAALRPGLAADRIDELLSSLPDPIPDDLHVLYSWHDGTEEVHGAYRAEIYRGGMFLPLEEAIADRAGGMEGSAGDWDERWLPLFTDEHAQFDAVVCGPNGGQIVSFSYVDLPDFEVAYGSMREFVHSLIRRWQLGVYSMNQWGGVHLDQRALGALRREEDGDEPDAPALVRSLRDGGETEWLAALVRLRTRLYPSAVPALIDMLLDPTAERRTYAAELLGVIGGESAADALRRAAESDPNDLERASAAAALRSLETGG